MFSLLVGLRWSFLLRLGRRGVGGVRLRCLLGIFGAGGIGLDFCFAKFIGTGRFTACLAYVISSDMLLATIINM